MSKNINFSLKTLQPQLKKAQWLLLKHALFVAILVVLLVYVLVVWRINQLANAEPSTDAETTALAASDIPKIDINTIRQIQNLEQTNTQVKSLFEQARNNPFQE